MTFPSYLVNRLLLSQARENISFFLLHSGQRSGLLGMTQVLLLLLLQSLMFSILLKKPLLLQLLLQLLLLL